MINFYLHFLKMYFQIIREEAHERYVENYQHQRHMMQSYFSLWEEILENQDKDYK